MTKPCTLAALALATALAGPGAGAQSVFDGELRAAPLFQQYRISSPAEETISQVAIPVFVTLPFGPSFSMDVGTSYARARVTSPNGVSEVSGLTDTQVRGNLTLGSDFVVLTAGLNLPTGQQSVALDQLVAASRIGSDFLAFPISNMGTGFAMTGGIAVARPVGPWSVGVGAAVRRSQSYEPFNIPDQSFSFHPGNEYRLRAGGDRPVRDGRLSLGLTYSAFANDEAGGSSYNVGDRVIGQGMYAVNASGTDIVVGAYDVFRTAGQYASGQQSGRENIVNAFVSAGFHPGGGLLEPTLELRHWAQQVATQADVVNPAFRSQSSVLATLGLRTRISLAGITAYPGVGFSVGSLASVDAASAPAKAGLTGFRAQVAMRAAPFAQ